MVDTDEICPQFLDKRKICRGLFKGSEGLTVFSGSKWAVGDAFEKEFLGALAKEFSIHSDTWTIGKEISHGGQTLGGTNIVTPIY